MQENELVQNYESFITNIEEVRFTMNILCDYLDCNPNLDDYNSLWDLVILHKSRFALLNILVDNLDSLIENNTKIVEKFYKERKVR